MSKAGLNLHLSLRSVGFDQSTHGAEATTVDPTAYSNRATYARGAMSEWYANGPAGLEQGFTLLHAPAAAQAGGDAAPLTLDLALAERRRPKKKVGDALASIDENYDAVFIDCPPGITLANESAMRAAHVYLSPVVPSSLARSSPHQDTAANSSRTWARRALRCLAVEGPPSKKRSSPAPR